MFGANVPVPEVVHVPPVAPPPTVPPNPDDAMPEHTVCAAPALAVTAWRTVNTTCAVAAPQGDWPALVSVSVTAPDEASAAEAV